MTNGRKPDTGPSADADHPDRHEIDDWFLSGPKNGQIEELVRELTLGRGLRLQEVETLIIDVLLNQKDTHDPDKAKSKHEINTLELAEDVPGQFRHLQKAYGTGSISIIDAAVIEVAEARRMKSNGVADMIASFSKDDPDTDE